AAPGGTRGHSVRHVGNDALVQRRRREGLVHGACRRGAVRLDSAAGGVARRTGVGRRRTARARRTRAFPPGARGAGSRDRGIARASGVTATERGAARRRSAAVRADRGRLRSGALGRADRSRIRTAYRGRSVLRPRPPEPVVRTASPVCDVHPGTGLRRRHHVLRAPELDRRESGPDFAGAVLRGRRALVRARSLRRRTAGAGGGAAAAAGSRARHGRVRPVRLPLLARRAAVPVTADRYWRGLGPGQFYSPDYFSDYPPGFLYVLWLVASVLGGMPQLVAKALSIPFDLAIGVALYAVVSRVARERTAAVAASLYLLNPALVLAGPYWGQVDAAGTLPLLLALVAAAFGRFTLAGALAGVAFMVKPQFGVPGIAVFAPAAF